MASVISVEIDETKLREIIADYFENQGFNIKPENLNIQVKSKQNYKAEWEQAAFRCTGTKSL